MGGARGEREDKEWEGQSPAYGPRLPCRFIFSCWQGHCPIREHGWAGEGLWDQCVLEALLARPVPHGHPGDCATLHAATLQIQKACKTIPQSYNAPRAETLTPS